MAEPLRHMYNPAFFERLCPVLSQHIPGFDCKDFIFRIFNNEWPDLELKERVRQISRVLHHFLSKDLSEASQQINLITHALQQCDTHPQSFENIFLADYIATFGLEHIDESMNAIEEITRLKKAIQRH